MRWRRRGCSASVFADVAVCIPTVRARAPVLAQTLAEWRRFGVAPIVQVQPDDWPQNGTSQRRNADQTLLRTLAERPDARHILYCEDDVLLAPDLDVWMPALKQLHAPVTLFLDGLMQFPHSMRRTCARGSRVPERIVRLRRLHAWWGSQAVLLPRAIVEDLSAWESSLECWDIHLRGFLEQHAIPIYMPVPNPVQHRGVPTSIAGITIVGHSLTFGRQSDGAGISPPAIDWCPYGDWDPDPRVR